MTETTPIPIKPAGLDHVVLRCTRLAATLDFYQRVLGCTLRRVDEKNHLYQLDAGPRALIDLVPVGSALGGDSPPGAAGFNMAHFCLRISAPDWAAVQTHLTSLGVAWEEPRARFGADGRGLSIYVSDPEGNQVELKAESNS